MKSIMIFCVAICFVFSIGNVAKAGGFGSSYEKKVEQKQDEREDALDSQAYHNNRRADHLDEWQDMLRDWQAELNAKAQSQYCPPPPGEFIPESSPSFVVPVPVPVTPYGYGYYRHWDEELADWVLFRIFCPRGWVAPDGYEPFYGDVHDFQHFGEGRVDGGRLHANRFRDDHFRSGHGGQGSHMGERNNFSRKDQDQGSRDSRFHRSGRDRDNRDMNRKNNFDKPRGDHQRPAEFNRRSSESSHLDPKSSRGHSSGFTPDRNTRGPGPAATSRGANKPHMQIQPTTQPQFRGPGPASTPRGANTPHMQIQPTTQPQFRGPAPAAPVAHAPIPAPRTMPQASGRMQGQGNQSRGNQPPHR